MISSIECKIRMIIIHTSISNIKRGKSKWGHGICGLSRDVFAGASRCMIEAQWSELENQQFPRRRAWHKKKLQSPSHQGEEQLLYNKEAGNSRRFVDFCLLWIWSWDFLASFAIYHHHHHSPIVSQSDPCHC